MRVLLIDNIDSFTWNIFHYLEALDADVFVKTNEEVAENDILLSDAVVLSPGPGLPSEAGKLMWAVDFALQSGKPLLGVCLGMQAIAEKLGGKLYNQTIVKHGVREIVRTESESSLFAGLPHTFNIGLYHSWAIDSATLPKEIFCSAFSENNVLMALENKQQKIYGVQFHPESILSDYGKEIFDNFLKTI